MPKVVIKDHSIEYKVLFVEDPDTRILFISDLNGELREAGTTTRRKTDENGTRIYFTWKDGPEHPMPYHTVADVVRYYGPKIQHQWETGFSAACIGQPFKERYDFTCPCGHQAMAAPSLLMQMGMNQGGCFCSKCDQQLRLRIDDANERMIATKIDFAAEAANAL